MVVALRAGAWIETMCDNQPTLLGFVALRAGAWIETRLNPLETRLRLSPSVRGRGLKHCISCCLSDPWWSPSVRGRGLKHQHRWAMCSQPLVALRAGAWIETFSVLFLTYQQKSPSVRGRGLKLDKWRGWICWVRSPSVRGRGLKLLALVFANTVMSRPPCGGVD